MLKYCGNCFLSSKCSLPFSMVACRNYLPLENFKQPLLLHVLSDESKLQDAQDVLQNFGVIIEETHGKPGFKIYFGKKVKK